MSSKTPYLRHFTSISDHIFQTFCQRILAMSAVLFSSLLLALACAWLPTQAIARGTVAATIGEIKLTALPREAQSVLKQIKKNGPYDYAKDGVIFSNRERILAKQKRGYYREFTVKTPGARNRGARRIVAGNVGEYFYTDDHYASFKRIIE